MRSEIKSYSNLVDNNEEVDCFKSAIDKLTSETNSMYLIVYINQHCYYKSIGFSKKTFLILSNS